MKRLTPILLALLCPAVLTACGGGTQPAVTANPDNSYVPVSDGDIPVQILPATDGNLPIETPPASDSDLDPRSITAELTVRDYGVITLELYPDKAPITVANFVRLAREGFYDGLTFHRIMDGFMIQGGDPAGNGTGGSGVTIRGEFSANGVDNDLSHIRGTISMARPGRDMDGASSQFFITVADVSASLDGQYAAFGRVVAGMEVADQIAADASPTDNNGTIPAAEQPVIESVRILD